MEAADRLAYVERYERRLREHGHAPQTLGWRPGRERARFQVMADVIAETGARSLLDVGCGFADLFDFLCEDGWEGDYHGIDLVPGLLAEARRRHPSLPVEEADIADHDPGRTFDVVVASGVFNFELKAEDNGDHIARSVSRMFELAQRALCVDFLSTHVDFRHPGAWHTDPEWALALGRSLSPRAKLRDDYLRYEFALVVYR
jgi:SAM-dependent methyltransferase